MELSIIIVSWNVRNLLKNCLRTVYQHTSAGSFEVFVVDNASHDGTQEMVKNDFPFAQIITNSDNKGFARANNQAIKMARGQFILLLNPDTEVTSGSLDILINYLKDHPSVGIAGPSLLNTDGSSQPSVRSFPTLGSLSMVFLKLHRLFPKTRSIRKLLKDDFDYSMDGKVDQIMGASFLIRKEVVKKIGLLDEEFFIWFEEVDYCKRTYNKGWEVWYVAKAKIVHHFAQSFGQVSTMPKQLIFTKSARHYARKHIGIFAWLILIVLTPISLFLAVFQQMFKNHYARS